MRHTGGRGLVRLRQALVIGEVAAALVLLVTAGLMLRSAARLAAVDPGFRTEGVLTFGVVLPGQTYPEPADRLQFRRARDRRRPRTARRACKPRRRATRQWARCARRGATRPRTSRCRRRAKSQLALDLPVGSGYFEVMGIRVVDGRTFTARDTPDCAAGDDGERDVRATHVSGPSARSARRIRFYSGRPGGTPPPTREIVGVVRDVRQDGVSAEPIPQMYTPYAQNSWSFVSFFVLVDGDPMALAPAVQRVVTDVDPMRPVRDVLTTSAIVRGSTERHRAMTVDAARAGRARRCCSRRSASTA